MAPLTCSEARDLASDLLDEELAPELTRPVEEHVARCPTCPNLYRAMLSVYRRLRMLRWEEEGSNGEVNR